MATTGTFTSWGDLDDSSSFTGSFFSSSSSSTVPGPGAITGRFLKAVGEKSLDLVVNIIIRNHLRTIDRTLTKSPHILRNPTGDEEWKRMLGAYTDLHELCRESRSEYYSLSLQKEAARLIHDITLITRPEPDFFILASPTNDKWEALLARIQHRRDIASLPPGRLVVSSRPKTISYAAPAKDDEGISPPWNFRHHVHVSDDLQGLPPSWVASLAVAERLEGPLRRAPDQTYSSLPHRDSGSPRILGELPSTQAPAQTILRRGARMLRKTPLVKHIQIIVNELSMPRDAGTFEEVTISKTNSSVILPSPKSTNTQEDDGISLPWNFRHHLHVNENLHGLPPSWISSLRETGFNERELAMLRIRTPSLDPLSSDHRNGSNNLTHPSEFTPTLHPIASHAHSSPDSLNHVLSDGPDPINHSPPPKYAAYPTAMI